MKSSTWQTDHKYRLVGKALVLFMTAGTIIHILVIYIDYHLITESIYLNLYGSFITSSFSAPMIPMIGVYGVWPIDLLLLEEHERNDAPCQ